MVCIRRNPWSVVCAALFLIPLSSCKDGTASPAEEKDLRSSDTAHKPDSSRQDLAGDLDVTQADNCPPLGAPDSAKWFHGGVGYEIFVRSFADSNGDGIGDLKGITQKLDYLNDGNPETTTDLGVTWIWLTPIFASPSYHGYDTVDYRAINPAFGTQQDLKDLVDACHQRGIKVILDLVMNHVGKEHPWFKEAQDPTSPKRDWFVWSDTAKDWTQPWSNSPVWHKAGNAWYYAVFWSGMPDLNYRNEAVKTEMMDVARYWIQQTSIDGYRLDAVRYLYESGPKEGQQDIPETLAYWKEFASTLLKDYPQLMLVGEAWASNSIAALYRVDGQGLNMTFDFDLMEALLAGIQAEEPVDIEGVFCRYPGQFPAGSSEVSFLSNHDLTRVFTRLKGSLPGMNLAAFLLMTLPGTPMIYYGDEIGLSNGALPKDEHKRLPMQWDGTANAGFTTGTPWQKPNTDYTTVNVQAQSADSGSLLNWYRQLSALRQAHPALNQGGFVRLTATSATTQSLWAFMRTAPSAQTQPLYVVVNFSSNPALNVTLTLPSLPPLPDAAPVPTTFVWPEAKPLVPGQGRTINLGDIPGQSGVVVK